MANGGNNGPVNLGNVVAELVRVGLASPLSTAIGLLTLLVILALFVLKTGLPLDQTVILALVMLFMSALTIAALQFVAALRPGQMKKYFEYPLRFLVWVATACVSTVLVSFTFSMLGIPLLQTIVEKVVGGIAQADPEKDPPRGPPILAPTGIDGVSPPTADAGATPSAVGAAPVAESPTPPVGPSAPLSSETATSSPGVEPASATTSPPPSSAAAAQPTSETPPEPQPFEVAGRVECQPAQLFGRDRERNTDAVVYQAPRGFKIVNESVSSVRVQDVSAVNGSIGPVEISEDGTRLSVAIGCRGGNIGEGRGWQSIRVVGAIRPE